MRIAALYDIHGNLPALQAVLNAIHRAGIDLIVVGGDIVPGPMPVESLKRLLDLDIPVRFIQGNCELAILAQMDAADPNSAAYWGTTSGKPLPAPLIEGYHWTAQQMLEYKALLTSWQKTLSLNIDGLGEVLFCHSTPRSETEIFTRLTSKERLLPLFEPLRVSLVVCGHTHMQFDRMVGKTRVVNAGSVGAPFGEPGAYWVLLGPDVQLRRTSYDFVQAAAQMRRTSYPQAQDTAQDLMHPPSEQAMLELYSTAELKP